MSQMIKCRTAEKVQNIQKFQGEIVIGPRPISQLFYQREKLTHSCVRPFDTLTQFISIIIN